MASSSDYNVLSICSGVGGLDLSLQISVHNAVTVCHVEREAQAAAVLEARMEDGSLHQAPVWSDLSSFDGKPWRGLVDCIISGDPCQPNSVAGSRLGAADDRFLIDQLIRVIDEVRPSRVFRENVTGNADGQLAALVPSLERMGYSVTAGIFSAGEVGASHRRERLFIMADANSGHDSREPGTNGQEERLSERDEDRLSQVQFTDGPQGEAEYISSAKLADANGGCSGARGGEQVGPQHILVGSQGDNKRELADAESLDDGRLSKREGEEHAGPSVSRGKLADLPYFAPGPNDKRWADIIQQAPSLEPALCTMADGVANRVDELRAVGNGVCSMAGAVAWLSLSAHFEQAR